MNSIFKTVVLTAIVASLGFAQGSFGPGNGNAGTHTPPDPATLIANQVARLTTLLDLTTAQAAQATSIFTAAQTASSPLQTTLDTDQTNLQAAVTSNNTATIDQLSAAIGTIQGQLLDIRSKADAAFYSILTAAQQTKLGTIGPGFGGPGFGAGFGGRGGRGPRP
jgi:Spy/CpxP family protein refolding chaperone